MSVKDYYSETLTLLTHDRATNPFDTGGDSWTTSKEFRAGVNQLNGNRQFIAGTHQVLAEYKVYCDVDTDITTGKRLRWDGEDYEITQLPKNTMQKGHHYTLLMRRVDD